MHRKWKSLSALGLAVMLGCLMPMDTMLAAEKNTEVVQETEADSVTNADEVSDAEAISDDNEIIDEEENAVDKKTGGEEKAEDETVIDEVDTDIDGNNGIAVMSETDGPEAEDVEVQSAAPVIDIKWNGQSYIYDLGGKVDYEYVNNHDKTFACSATQDGQAVSVSYCLEMVSDITAEAKGTEKMSSLKWESANPERIPLSKDRSYVLYVKAVGTDGQTTYARSGGVVVDTTPPAITELVEGKTYPEGTKFQVSDANLESVKVNETIVTPESGGYYRVTANGTSSSCVIKLKDKAGNEKTYSINVSRDAAEDGVISANGIYSLTAGTPYQLAEGQWQLIGDRSVYPGGNTFYVKADGNYSFMKR